ncbi:MAG: hypothetical protein EA392_11450 [Cryomorphaceae bacterium]|nr:MAG: hypothetical protein EA392_11450 [Cryomorphaceae bacterium]
MKKLMILLVMAGSLMSAKAETTVQDPVENVSKAITEKVKVPEHLKRRDFSEKVEATIKLHPEGQIEVLELNTNDRTLSRYIREQLEEINLPGLAVRALTFTTRFTLKVL